MKRGWMVAIAVAILVVLFLLARFEFVIRLPR
jgi:hypothetical protein